MCSGKNEMEKKEIAVKYRVTDITMVAHEQTLDPLGKVQVEFIVNTAMLDQLQKLGATITLENLLTRMNEYNERQKG